MDCGCHTAAGPLQIPLTAYHEYISDIDSTRAIALDNGHKALFIYLTIDYIEAQLIIV